MVREASWYNESILLTPRNTLVSRGKSWGNMGAKHQPRAVTIDKRAWTHLERELRVLRTARTAAYPWCLFFRAL